MEDFLLQEYSNLPKGKYVNIIIVRKTLSETIFRTEGSGEPLNREYVHAGINDTKVIPRIVISKRKQTAVERRTGRELLRGFNLLPDGTNSCMLNTNNPCEKCVDCWVYGYAVGSGGAQKSRVITEDAFSILPSTEITDTKTFNALYDNNTMRNPLTGEASTSINSSEYIKPETFFIDIEVLKDVTRDEMLYVLGNILRSTRYGAISSKIGRIKNIIAGIVFSDSEIFSTLELTQKIYDINTTHPQQEESVLKSVKKAIPELLENMPVRKLLLSEEDLISLLQEINKLYETPEEFLKELSRSYPKNTSESKESKKTSKKRSEDIEKSEESVKEEDLFSGENA
jgi:CRISPR-associated protein Csc2